MEIRPGRVEDLEQLNDLYNEYVDTSPVTFDIEPITMDARRAWFNEFGNRYLLFVALDGERIIGYAHSKYFRPKQAYETSVETTVYVAQSEVGKGVGGQLYSALFAGWLVWTSIARTRG